uniref:Uncharacterized protein n=1 Tax=Anolis carolinensis TaxID=28377 RepID=A0A803TKS7_ANOCA
MSIYALEQGSSNLLRLLRTFSRSAFTARKDDPNNPNWVKVGLTLGATVAIWLLVRSYYLSTILSVIFANNLDMPVSYACLGFMSSLTKH